MRTLMIVVDFIFNIITLVPAIILCYLPFTDRLNRPLRKIVTEAGLAAILTLTVILVLYWRYDINLSTTLYFVFIGAGFIYYQRTVRESFGKLMFVFCIVFNAASFANGIDLFIVNSAGIYIGTEKWLLWMPVLMSVYIVSYLLFALVMRRFLVPRLRHIDSLDVKWLWVLPLVTGVVIQYFYADYNGASHVTSLISPILLTLYIFSFFMYYIMLRMLDNAATRTRVQAEKQETDKELRKALHEAKLANRAKSFFLASMSHEIRTPMNAILGITEIEMKKRTLPPDTAEALEKIYESGELLLNIINDILDFSKIEAEKMEIRPVTYNLPNLINETVRMNLIRFDNKQIDFIVDVNEETPQSIYGDKLRIKQVLNNILSNALKYTDKGEVRLSVSAEPLSNGQLIIDNGKLRDDNPEENDNNSQFAESDISLVLSVSDTGCGMTEEQVDKLFQEYMRFNLNTDGTVPGTGLGMSITKRLVDLMGGAITVSSEVSKGTTITMHLPQKTVDDTVCGQEVSQQLRSFNYHRTPVSAENQTEYEHMTGGRVLIVDDMKTNIYVTKGMLKPYGLSIDTATSGFEAIEKIKNGEVYDIIFMDYMMPGMNGMEATKVLRDMGYENAISALTANALTGQAEIFLENGFDEFLSKPIDSVKLYTVLCKFIRDRKQTDTAS